ncbi:MAG: hypothetical protein JJT94_16920, partial [Bernardetiaceae bacterium]|nr:hypothetical protein [Bernardetiaceae bacterium]
MENQPISYQEVLALFRETDKKFQKTDERFKQTEQLVKSLSKQIGEITDNLGRFAEQQIQPVIMQYFNEYGVKLNVHTRNFSLKDENGRFIAEIDLLLFNHDNAVAL